jgi:hypothetical protein
LTPHLPAGWSGAATAGVAIEQQQINAIKDEPVRTRISVTPVKQNRMSRY